MQYAKCTELLVQPDGFRIITVGSGAPPFDPERSAPCTLVQFQDKRFVVDLGNGAYRNIGRLGIDCAQITNVLFTHLHSDHTLDYGYFLITGWHDGRTCMHVMGPRGIRKMHDMYLDLYSADIQYRADLGISLKGIREDVYFRELEGSECFERDGVVISTLHVPHTAHTIAYKLEAGGETVVVSGDLMYYEPFADFAKGADVIVVDANQVNSAFIKERGPGFVENLNKSHITVEEIGILAQKAEAKAIILTHLTRGAYIGDAIRRISKRFSGEIIPAYDLMAVDVRQC